MRTSPVTFTLSFLKYFSYFISLFLFFHQYSAAEVVEISGSPFDIKGAPLPERIATNEKLILIDPKNHFYGAYRANGTLIRWGIATTGSLQCRDSNETCLTQIGVFRIYSLGNENCVSKKYGGAQMPYCMYFKGGQAIHGSTEIQSANLSHGCVRVHIADAQWLRYHFVEGPSSMNQYKGTKVIISQY